MKHGTHPDKFVSGLVLIQFRLNDKEISTTCHGVPAVFKTFSITSNCLKVLCTDWFISSLVEVI